MSVEPAGVVAGSASASLHLPLELLGQLGRREVDVLLGDADRLGLLAALRRGTVGDLEEDRILAAGHVVDGVRRDVAGRARLDRLDPDRIRAGNDGRPADDLGFRHASPVPSVRKRTSESVATMLPAGMVRLPLGVEVRERHRSLGLGLDDPDAGGREVALCRDRDLDQLGGDDAVGLVDLDRGRVGGQRPGDRSDRLERRRDGDRRLGQDEDGQGHGEHPDDGDDGQGADQRRRGRRRMPVERTGPPTTGRAADERGPGPRGGGGTEATSAPNALAAAASAAPTSMPASLDASVSAAAAAPPSAAASMTFVGSSDPASSGVAVGRRLGDGGRAGIDGRRAHRRP